VWIDYNYHHSPVRWPNRTEPWEILYVRVNSPQMDQIARTLSVENNPLFTVSRPAKALAGINAIFKLLRDRPIAMEAMLHAAVSSLIAILFEARQASLLGHLTEQPESRAAANLAKILSVMRQEYDRRWKAPELARLMGMSVPQFYRRFTLAMGTSPMAWLRRERVNHAKRRLIETDQRIREIAHAVGYADALHFSRDFCRMVGVSPRNYRARERVNSEPDKS
jgi:AraC family transcriptional regulator, arabinose operon regulatory protein